MAPDDAGPESETTLPFATHRMTLRNATKFALLALGALAAAALADVPASSGPS